jgi:SAM-dependent methyltransferase
MKRVSRVHIERVPCTSSQHAFQQADLSKEMNFAGQETFDVVHARFVMCHVSSVRPATYPFNGHPLRFQTGKKDAIERAARLVRPGGLLIIEEGDFNTLIQTCAGNPSVQRFLAIVSDAVSARGGDMDIGRKLESILTSLKGFKHVQVNTLAVPFDGSGGE